MSRLRLNGTCSIKMNGTCGISMTADTADPSILDYALWNMGDYIECRWKVRNNDTVNATIYTECGDDTPDLHALLVVAGATSGTLTQNLGPYGQNGTIYAYAEASGKGPSGYVSVYVA